jgi:sigma-B regulation protein RsbU (phosphoserine phosphatase)
MNILIVDDAKDMRFIISSIVKKLGHTFTEAVDGEDAWGKLQADRFDAILCDWQMPRLDGIGLCKRIREYDFPNYIYIILLTGLSGKKNILDGINAGADGFASKPVNLDEIRIRLLAAQRVVTLENDIAEKNKALQEAHDHIEKDLKAAASTQLKSLPAPLTEGSIQTSWFYKPAIYIGGDTFDYYKTQNGCFVFYSVDISGHGISAAMLSMSLQVSLGLKRGLYGGAITRDRLEEIPALFASNLNKRLLDQGSDHYLTMLFGIVDMYTNKIYFVQAGHPHPYINKRSDNTILPLEVNGFPVGLCEGVGYETQIIQMDKGDQFIVYSDGISENQSMINNEVLEGTNLTQHFDKIKHLDGKQMNEAISTQWLSTEQIEELPDDVSFLIIEFDDPPPKQ